jgi:hypothetical protein
VPAIVTCTAPRDSVLYGFGQMPGVTSTWTGCGQELGSVSARNSRHAPLTAAVPGKAEADRSVVVLDANRVVAGKASGVTAR